MSNNASRERAVFRILLKENFRSFLKTSENINDFFLDSDRHVQIPFSVGCLYSSGTWEIYETDERGICVCEKRFSSTIDAFQDAASRRNLIFFPSMIVEDTATPPCSIEQFEKEIDLVHNAYKTLKIIARFLRLTDHPHSVDDDLSTLLVCMLEDISKLSSVKIQSIRIIKKLEMPTIPTVKLYTQKNMVLSSCAPRDVFTFKQETVSRSLKIPQIDSIAFSAIPVNSFISQSMIAVKQLHIHNLSLYIPATKKKALSREITKDRQILLQTGIDPAINTLKLNFDSVYQEAQASFPILH